MVSHHHIIRLLCRVSFAYIFKFPPLRKKKEPGEKSIHEFSICETFTLFKCSKIHIDCDSLRIGSALNFFPNNKGLDELQTILKKL